MNSQMLNRKSLKEQVRDILFDRIISGELAPGDRVKIVPIAESLQVSQAPVREAIQCLVTSGYLEQHPNVGVKVKAFTKQDVREICHVRKLLEADSLGSVTPEDGRRLADVLDGHLKGIIEAVEAQSFTAYALHDTRFHRCLVEASGNAKMLAMWDSLLIPRLVVMTIRELGVTMDTLIPLHVPIVARLREGDVGGAVAALLAHYTFLKV